MILHTTIMSFKFFSEELRGKKKPHHNLSVSEKGSLTAQQQTKCQCIFVVVDKNKLIIQSNWN
jgi:hypothetical protein